MQVDGGTSTLDIRRELYDINSKHYVVMSFIAKRFNTQFFGRYEIVSPTIIQG